MRHVKSILILLCSLMLISANAQEKKLSVSGYVSGMPSIIVQQQTETEVWWQGLVHNRLNFNGQINKYFRIDVGMRNRLITGSDILLNPQSISYDAGRLNLSCNIKESKFAVLNSSFDRLHLTFEKDKWKLQLGRQRINWGQTFVWNANDIFNTYSFFDFDYPERSGCDALRLTYYSNETSLLELAASLNRNDEVTTALLYRWNWKNIDFQVLAGEQAGKDIIIGGAITSDIKGLNIRSEASYFHPIKSIIDTSGIVAVSFGLDYVFSNSLMLQAEALYNNVGKDASNGSGLMALYAAPLSAKRLSICEWNIFTQVSYPFTPRFNGSLSGMYFIDMQSFFTGMSLDYSIITNLDFSFVAQYFYLNKDNFPNRKDMHVFLGFARVKYSF